MDNPNEIILFSREEAEQQFERPLTDLEWERLKEWITTDDNLWSVIDSIIFETLEQLKLVNHVKDNNG